MSRTTLPRISIVTPSYQQSRFIERTLESVHSQGYPHLEHIVIDGGSTDGSVEIIRRYEDRLAFWCSERDKGQSDAINRGLRRATGEVLGWLNSDDTFAPGALHRIGEYYAAHPEVDLLYGHTHVIDAEDRILRRLLAIPTNAQELIRFTRDVWSQPGTTWRRRLQERIGLLDESLHFAMDGDFWIRAALNGTIRFVPQHFANLRFHEQTKSSSALEKFVADHQELDRRYGAMQRDRLSQTLWKLRRWFRIVRNPRSLLYRVGLVD
jgi:glycosyltransferase involved in cell wall biosynthesis